jgi:hypothetical protein
MGPIDAPNGAQSALFVSSPEAAKQSRERMSHAGDDDAATLPAAGDRGLNAKRSSRIGPGGRPAAVLAAGPAAALHKK